jgi:hypothetical protein
LDRQAQMLSDDLRRLARAQQVAAVERGKGDPVMRNLLDELPGQGVRLGQRGDLWLNNDYLGRASAPGEYLIRLPNPEKNLIGVETLFHLQKIVVNTARDGNVRIEYEESKPKEKQ